MYSMEEGYTSTLSLANEGKLKPHICKIFSFEHSLKALKYLKDRKLIGKVVISIS